MTNQTPSTTAQCGAGEALLPCPFCGKPLFVSSRPINPKAYCRTEDCYGKKMPCVNLDVPSDVAAWNARSTPPSPVRAAQEDAYATIKTMREEIVLAIAFLGRDSGTDRLQGTVDSLIQRLTAVDKLALATLAAPQDNTQQKEEGEIMTGLVEQLLEPLTAPQDNPQQKGEG